MSFTLADFMIVFVGKVLLRGGRGFVTFGICAL